MNPYYQDDYVTIYHGNCMDMLPIQADSVVSDPPYGMGWDVKSSRFSGGETARLGRKRRDMEWKPVLGDSIEFDPEPWLGYENVILWGSNHFGRRLPTGTTLVWVKKNDASFGSFLSDAEVAWMKGGHGVYCFKDTSGNGAGANYPKLHPTQKTIRVMRWCIEKTTGVVLDPFMGSGTTLRAAKDLNRKAIGIEVEERYCEVAARRMEQGVLPLHL